MVGGWPFLLYSIFPVPCSIFIWAVSGKSFMSSGSGYTLQIRRKSLAQGLTVFSIAIRQLGDYIFLFSLTYSNNSSFQNQNKLTEI
jgi:hypothetical protein